MSTEIDITADNLLNISTKLDGLDLSVEEKGLLCAVFQSAACEIHGDVSGFGLTGDLSLGGVFSATLGVDSSTGSVDVSLPGTGDVTFVIGDPNPSPRGRVARDIRRTV